MRPTHAVFAHARQERNHRYVSKDECEALWEANLSVDHPDISLPHGWHLNCARVSVLPPPDTGPKLDAEMRCWIRKVPEAMRCDRMYQNRQFWYDFLAWEHTAHQRSAFHGDYQPWEAFPVEDPPPPLGEDDEEEDDNHVVKDEVDVAMEDAALPGAVDLPLEYQAVIAAGYDKEALLRQVFEESKANEDKIFPGYSDFIALTGMVAEYIASLPPPPPLLSPGGVRGVGGAAPARCSALPASP
jgi:hypothetical protein